MTLLRRFCRLSGRIMIFALALLTLNFSVFADNECPITVATYANLPDPNSIADGDCARVHVEDTNSDYILDTVGKKWTKFLLNVNIPSDSLTFNFDMYASGVFTVDCGDDGSLASATGVSGKTITRSNTTGTRYTCNYTTGGNKTITMDGAATGYNASSSIRFYSGANDTARNTNVAKITGIAGSLGQIFGTVNNVSPGFYAAFRNAINLTSIPNTLFSGITTASTHMFYYTFEGSGLTSVPAGLFSNITTGTADGLFLYTFGKCKSLTTVPSDLFASSTNPRDALTNMFSGTFEGSGLTSVPAGLFSNITGTADGLFYRTFYNCKSLKTVPADLFASSNNKRDASNNMFEETFAYSGLTSVPAGLFSNITETAERLFLYTFRGCKSLTTVSSDLFASSTNPRDASNNMFDYTFEGSGLTSVPAGLFSNITGTADNLFRSTFQNCTSLTSVPGDLFGTRTAGKSMFMSTFASSGLTSVPSTLFNGISGEVKSGMFSSTFKNISALTSVTYPDGSTTNYLPYNFFGNLNVTSDYVSGAMTDMFTDSNAEFSTSCPSPGTAPYNTVYDSELNGKVLCQPATYTINYDCNNGNANTNSSQSVDYNSMFTANICTYPGHTFQSYSCLDANKQAFDLPNNNTQWKTILTDGAVINCTANWSNTVYTINFKDADGNALTVDINGTPQTSTTWTYDPNGSFTLPDESAVLANNPGKSFNGWWDSGYTEVENQGNIFYRYGVSGIKFGDAGDSISADTIVNNATEKVLNIYAQVYKSPVFWMNTTTINENDYFSFVIALTAGTFYVDWGDGVVEKLFYTSGMATSGQYSFIDHTYSETKSYKIGLSSENITDYNTTEYAYNASSGWLSSSKAPMMLSFSWSKNPTYVTPTKLAGIEGRLGQVFPTLANGKQPGFVAAFDGCTNLTSNIPAELFDGIYGQPRKGMFAMTFYNTGLIGEIPGTLFSHIDETTGERVGIIGTPTDGLFGATFMYSPGLTGIGSGLFDGISGPVAPITFRQTFYEDSGITGQLSSDLFKNITGVATGAFRDAFYGTNIGKTVTGEKVSIPVNLFQNISGTIPAVSNTNFAMFSKTFANTLPENANPNDYPYLKKEMFSGITGYIANNEFGNRTAATPYTAGGMSGIFTNSAVATVCPAGYYQYITGFEADWDGRVACELCPTGYTSDADGANVNITRCYNANVACDATDEYNGTFVSGHLYYAGEGVADNTEYCIYDYDVNYENIEGVNMSLTPTTYNKNSTERTLPAPTRPGYTFAGWYSKADFSDTTAVTEIPSDSRGLVTYYAKWNDCPNGSYCDGTSNTPISCSTLGSQYTKSDTNASSPDNCYRECVAGDNYDVPHATAVTGSVHYSADGEINTCAPADENSCTTGYEYIIGIDLYNIIDSSETPIDSGARSIDGEWTNSNGNMNVEKYNLTDDGTFVLDYGNKGKAKGSGFCSPQEGDTDNYTWNNSIAVNTLGNETGDYCWCKFDNYISSSGEEQRIISNWVYVNRAGSQCEEVCSLWCSGWASSNVSFRTAMFNAIEPTPASCSVKNYTITYNGVDGATNNNPSTYTVNDMDDGRLYLESLERTGYEFDGWYDENDDEISYISGTGNRTLTAHWTPEEYNIYYYDWNGDMPVSISGLTPDIHVYGKETILPTPTRNGLQFEGWYDNNTGFREQYKIESIPADFADDKAFLFARWSVACSDVNPVTAEMNASGAATYGNSNDGRAYCSSIDNYGKCVLANANACEITNLECANNAHFERGFDLPKSNTSTTSYDMNTGIWTATWSSGTLTGEASSNSINATKYSTPPEGITITKSYPITDSDEGSNCWCKITSWTDSDGNTTYLSADWVYLMGLGPDSCITACAAGFHDITLGDPSEYRTAMYSTITNLPIPRCVVDSKLITYHDGNETLSLEPAVYTPGTGVDTLPTPPAKTGYTFAGWYDANGDQITSIGSDATEDITLYAHWNVPCATVNPITADMHATAATYANESAECVPNATTGACDLVDTSACSIATLTCNEHYTSIPATIAPDLNALIGTDAGDGWIFIQDDGRVNRYRIVENSADYELSTSDPNSFAIDYGNRGVVYGYGRCSSQSGTSNNWQWTDPTLRTNLENENGQPNAQYCYCNLTGYKPAGRNLQSFLSSWVFYSDLSSGDSCTQSCVSNCAYFLRNGDDFYVKFRMALFNAVQSSPAQCVLDTYTINFKDADGNPLEVNGATSATWTYGSGDFTLPDESAVLANNPDKSFNGWWSGPYVQTFADGELQKIYDMSGDKIELDALTQTTKITAEYIVANANENKELNVYAQIYKSPVFWMTTIPLSTSDNNFRFVIGLLTGTTYVNWGDGQVQKIQWNINEYDWVSHNYVIPANTTQSYRIGLSSENITNYVEATSTGGTAKFHIGAGTRYGGQYTSYQKLAGIEGCLGCVFPTIPDGNGGVMQPSFSNTFNNCSNLTGTNIEDPNNPGMKYAIPPTLFDNIYGAPAPSMFSQTFYHCSNLSGSIPQHLFGDLSGAPAQYMFSNTFDGCTNLTGNIPTDLFCSDPNDSTKCITGAPADWMYNRTFAACPNLTGTIPKHFFGNISGPVKAMSFNSPFMNTNLKGPIPEDLFENVTGAASGGFRRLFAGTDVGHDINGNVTPVPADLFKKLSGEIPAYGDMTNTPPMFHETFKDSKIPGFKIAGKADPVTYVPSTFFGSLTRNSHTTDVLMNMFDGDNLIAESCDAGTYKYTVGLYGNLPNNKVSCTACPDGYWSVQGDNDTINRCYRNEPELYGCPPTDSYDGTYSSGRAYYAGENTPDNTEYCIYDYDVNYENIEGVNMSLTPTTYNKNSTSEQRTLPDYLNVMKPGYTFGGWYDNASFEGTAITEIPSDSRGLVTYYAKWNDCPNGSYCDGLSNTPISCSTLGSQYTKSDTNASSPDNCYRECVAGDNYDVPHATAVTGSVHYSAYGEVSTCAPADANSCVTGYDYQAAVPDLNEIINTATYSSYEYIGNDGEEKGDDLGLTEDHTWAVEYENNKGTIIGQARCSSVSGTGAWQSMGDANNITTHTTPELGEFGDKYCYCNLTGYKTASGALQSLSSPWVFNLEHNGPDGGALNCASGCAGVCAGNIRSTDTNFLLFRTAVFNAVESSPASCSLATYTITYNGVDGATNSNPTEYTYESETITLQDPVKGGYKFNGWYNDAEFTNRVTEIPTYSTGNKTFYADLEDNCMSVTLNPAGGTSGSRATLYYKKDKSPGAPGVGKITFYIDDVCSIEYTSEYYNNVIPTREGYLFAGFSNITNTTIDSDDLHSQPVILSPNGAPYFWNPYTEDITINAKWAKNCTVPSNGSCSLNITDLGRIDYTTSCENGYDLSGNNTANPVCTLIQYVITYNLYGGNNNENNPETYNINSDTIRLDPPYRSNSVFLGWCTDLEDSTTCDMSPVIPAHSTGDITYHAKWKCKEGYVKQEAPSTTSNEYQYKAISVTGGDTNNPDNDLGAGEWKEIWDNGDILKGSAICTTRSVHTNWGHGYSDYVSYFPEDSSGTNCWCKATEFNGDQLSSMWISSYPTMGNSCDVPCARACASFFQSNTDFRTEIFNGISDDLNKCILEPYNIIYANVDGATNNNPSTYTIESETITLSAPTREGYTFAGWTENGNTITQITTGTAGNKTLTANWAAIENTCRPGMYYNATTKQCELCKSDYYCPNTTTYTVETSEDTGLVFCGEHSQSVIGSWSVEECFNMTGDPCSIIRPISIANGTPIYDGGDAYMIYSINNSIINYTRNPQACMVRGVNCDPGYVSSGEVASVLQNYDHSNPVASISISIDITNRHESSPGQVSSVGFDDFDSYHNNYAVSYISGNSDITVLGVANCSSTDGEYSIFGEPDIGNAGTNCWCNLTTFRNNEDYIPNTALSRYKYLTGFDDTATCQNQCAQRCEEEMFNNSEWADSLIADAKGDYYCTKGEYTITYELDGGENNENNPESYIIDNLPITLGEPTRANSTFLGWCTDLNDDTTCSETPTITNQNISDKTYYAKWDCNTGYEYQPEVPDFSSFMFLNYLTDHMAYIDKDGAYNSRSKEYTQLDFGITEPDTWATDLGFNNGFITGRAKCSAQSGAEGDTTDSLDSTQGHYTWCQVTGYKFKKVLGEQNITAPWVLISHGYNEDTTGSYCVKYAAENCAYRANTHPIDILFAVAPSPASCSLVTYTITYELDGGTNNENNPESYTIDNLPITLGEPSRANSTFLGWCTDLNDNTTCSETPTITDQNISNKTYYAKWGCDYGYEPGTVGMYIENNIPYIGPYHYCTLDNDSYDCQDRETGSFRTDFNDGATIEYVSGIYSCNGSVGSRSDMDDFMARVDTNADFTNDVTGQYCWIKITKMDDQHVGSYWVYLRDYDSDEDCATRCGWFDFDESELIASFYALANSVTNEACAPMTQNVNLMNNYDDDDESVNNTVRAAYNAALTPMSATTFTYIDAPTRAGYVFAGFYDNKDGTGTAYFDEYMEGAVWDKTTPTTLYAKWNKCEAGTYCPGDNTINMCPGNYQNSDAGSDEKTDCYRVCEPTDVPGSTARIGGVYYSESGEVNKCAPADENSCATGYEYKAATPGLTTIIGVTKEGTGSGYRSNSGSGDNYNESTYGITNNGEFVVDYGSKGEIHGYARCSTRAGASNAWTDTYNVISSNFVDELTDETGQEGARYCYCQLDGYTQNGGTLQSLSSPWVFLRDNFVASSCADLCASYCAPLLRGDYAPNLAFRAAVFNTVQSTPAQCSLKTYTITYHNGEDVTTADYNVTMGNVDLPIPTKEGFVFDGWYNNESYETKVTGISAATPSDLTLYAKWNECSDGYYCPGDNTEKSCATEIDNSKYTHSDGAKSSINDCYRGCELTDASHATDVIGKVHYSETGEIKACEPTDKNSCEFGYKYKLSKLPNYFGGASAGQQDHNSIYANWSLNDVDDTEIMRGLSVCISEGGNGEPYDNPTYNNTFTGEETGRYCWCKTTELEGQEVTSSWLFDEDYGSYENCKDSCWDTGCGYRLYDEKNRGRTHNFEEALFGAIDGNLAQCVLAEYKITYMTDGGIATNPLTYNVTQLPITLQTPTRANSRFLGWCTDKELQHCSMSQTISNTTGDKTFYAKFECNDNYVENGNASFPDVSELPIAESIKARSHDGTLYFENEDWYESGDLTSEQQTAYNAMNNGEWELSWGDNRIMRGIAHCASVGGDNNDYTWNNDSSNWTRPSETFDGTADGSDPSRKYCWCKATDFVGQSLSSMWLFVSEVFSEEVSSQYCAEICAFGCATEIFGEGEISIFRSALFSTISDRPEKCMLQDFNITYDLNGGAWTDENYQVVNTYNALNHVQLPTAVDIYRPEHNFVGWCVNTQNCSAEDVITSTSELSEFGNVNLYALWTSECPTKKYLHIGNGRMCLHQGEALTSPALAISIDGEKYYAMMTPTTEGDLPISKCESEHYYIMFNGTKYSVHDNSVNNSYDAESMCSNGN